MALQEKSLATLAVDQKEEYKYTVAKDAHKMMVKFTLELRTSTIIWATDSSEEDICNDAEVRMRCKQKSFNPKIFFCRKKTFFSLIQDAFELLRVSKIGLKKEKKN